MASLLQQQDISTIVRLNREGIGLTGPEHGYNFIAAIGKHVHALRIAIGARGAINPDYALWSEANLAYAARREYADRNLCLSLIDEALDYLDSFYWQSVCSKTYFGQARLFEEKGIVLWYLKSEKDPAQDLQASVHAFYNTLSLYELAEKNPDAEIVSKDEIHGRVLRACGITGSIVSELADYRSGAERDNLLAEAVKLVQAEVHKRLQAGEKKSRPLVNAYHLLGKVQSELVDPENEEMYCNAGANLITALDLAQEVGDVLTSSVLLARFAWLEYKRNPKNKSMISGYLDGALAMQSNHDAQWDKGIEALLKEKMEVLNRHLGRGAGHT